VTGAQLHHLRTRLLDVSLTRVADVVGSTVETIRDAEAMGRRRIPLRLERRLMRGPWWHLHLGYLRADRERRERRAFERQVRGYQLPLTETTRPSAA